MHLKSIELSGFKSFAKKSSLEFTSPISGIVGPNGSGKSNVAEAFRFVLGEQSMKAMRGKRGPDMIWAGNERTQRANMARVAVAFDNKNHLLDIDFDEVVIERTVHRDGANEYAINGSRVRLKDITSLLATANIGTYSHHIISQGEADRILGASERERRAMIEDALGLKTYQYKKAESEKKLEKTAENMKEVKSLRREIAPHLKFLEKQMQKLERSRELKEQLKEAYSTYVAHERAFVREESRRLETARVHPQGELERITSALGNEEKQTTEPKETEELNVVDERLRVAAEEKSKLEHARGRIEGQIALVRNGKNAPKQQWGLAIPLEKVESFLKEIKEGIHKSRRDVSLVNELLERIDDFISSFKETEEKQGENPELAESLDRELKEVGEALSALESEEAALLIQRSDALGAIATQQDREREAQARYFKLKEQRREAEIKLENVEREARNLLDVQSKLKEVERKAQDIGVSPNFDSVDSTRSRGEQVEQLREIERIEARLEEAGFVDEDTVHEFEETKKRDSFLEREVNDLEQSRNTLLEIIDSLEHELSTRFGEGLDKVNSEFQKFFEMLFEGGSAILEPIKFTKRNEEGEEVEDEELKEGIEIRVQLPRKKVASLDVLSGGERALTSIALIFAMSQVNPPPFIILDETDAALDEANSRKYADMVRALSDHSQLILITHNRQTMEAAGELYGVTMGSDGISKLLSVKFDEAVSVAK
ncbi:hypothetical protein CL652_02070 [bacterium]|nr:hypothetical protein [bacterium]|tara:strand:+ start:10344 stop:12497 length:2154 start_codon:yes stop_codon:yes gene_type:complete